MSNKQSNNTSANDFMSQMWNGLEWYFFNNYDPNNIPEVLAAKENEWIVKREILFYFNNVNYFVELNKLNSNFKLWNMSTSELLKYAKYVVDKYNLSQQNKAYISRPKFKDKMPLSEKEFKEFSKYVDSKTYNRYSHRDKLFLASTLLSKEELISFVPSLAVKADKIKQKSKINKIKQEFNQKQVIEESNLISNNKNAKDLIIILSDSQINVNILQAIFNESKVEFLDVNTDPNIILSKNPKLIIGIGSKTFSVLNDNIKKTSMRLYPYKYDNTITVTTIPKESKAMEQYIDFIKKFMKSTNNARAIINENSVDMSRKSRSLTKINSWDELLNYVKDGWKIATTQLFHNEYEFKEPLALIVLKRGSEKLFLNANNLDYVYYTYDHPVDIKHGIEPLESLDKLTKQSMSMKDYVQKRNKYFKKYERPRLFEADIAVPDKLMSYAKEYCRPHFEDVNQIIETDITTAYIDIEVYMDEGFEQPENSRKAVNAFAYSLGDSTHVDIYILHNTPLESKYELIDKFLDDAKQSVVEHQKSTRLSDDIINRINSYTYEVHTCSTEEELLRELDNLIKRDQPDVLSAWNIWFDINYLINRVKYLGIQDITFSPIGIKGYISSQNGLYQSPGMDVIDMLESWKGSIKGEPKSAKLNYAGSLELGLHKIEYDGDLCQLYDNDVVKFTGYNAFDVIIFKEIDVKKHLIEQKMFYRQVTGCSTNSIDSTIKSVDTVSTEFARKKNLALRNNTYLVTKDKAYKGALTIARQPGVHLLVTDLDQTSQYPSMMQTFNLSADTLNMIIDVDYETLYRYIHENKLPKNLDQIVNVTYKPLTWFGGDNLGVKTTAKLGEVLEIIKKNDWILTVTGAVFLKHEQKKGFYLELLETFREFRNKFKKQMKEAHKAGDITGKLIYNNLQLAMKILINSVYGCTGTDSYRFFHVAISETITTMARTEISVVASNLERLIMSWEDNLELDKIVVEKY